MIEQTYETPFLLQKRVCKNCKAEKIRLEFVNEAQNQCKACVYAKRNKRKINVPGCVNSWKNGFWIRKLRAVDLL